MDWFKRKMRPRKSSAVQFLNPLFGTGDPDAQTAAAQQQQLRLRQLKQQEEQQSDPTEELTSPDATSQPLCDRPWDVLGMQQVQAAAVVGAGAGLRSPAGLDTVSDGSVAAAQQQSQMKRSTNATAAGPAAGTSTQPGGLHVATSHMQRRDRAASSLLLAEALFVDTAAAGSGDCTMCVTPGAIDAQSPTGPLLMTPGRCKPKPAKAAVAAAAAEPCGSGPAAAVQPCASGPRAARTSAWTSQDRSQTSASQQQVPRGDAQLYECASPTANQETQKQQEQHHCSNSSRQQHPALQQQQLHTLSVALREDADDLLADLCTSFSSLQHAVHLARSGSGMAGKLAAVAAVSRASQESGHSSQRTTCSRRSSRLSHSIRRVSAANVGYMAGAASAVPPQDSSSHCIVMQDDDGSSSSSGAGPEVTYTQQLSRGLSRLRSSTGTNNLERLLQDVNVQAECDFSDEELPTCEHHQQGNTGRSPQGLLRVVAVSQGGSSSQQGAKESSKVGWAKRLFASSSGSGNSSGREWSSMVSSNHRRQQTPDAQQQADPVLQPALPLSNEPARHEPSSPPRTPSTHHTQQEPRSLLKQQEQQRLVERMQQKQEQVQASYGSPTMPTAPRHTHSSSSSSASSSGRQNSSGRSAAATHLQSASPGSPHHTVGLQGSTAGSGSILAWAADSSSSSSSNQHVKLPKGIVPSQVPGVVQLAGGQQTELLAGSPRANRPTSGPASSTAAQGTALPAGGAKGPVADAVGTARQKRHSVAVTHGVLTASIGSMLAAGGQLQVPQPPSSSKMLLVGAAASPRSRSASVGPVCRQ